MDSYYSWIQDKNLEKKPHQIDAIKWCLEKEQGTELFGRTIKGGILADEMGLGKTYELLGTMVCNPQSRNLIVVPLSLLDQWKQIILEKTDYNLYVFHGNNKNVDKDELLEFNLVLTTYGCVSLKNNTSNIIHEISWDRVIYDEAHNLRNDTGKKFGAMKISTKITWLLTGTPIQNRIQDLYSLFQILDVFNLIATRNDKKITVTKEGVERVQIIKKQLILKRTKKELGIDISNIEFNNIYIDWNNANEVRTSEIIHKNIKYSTSGGEKLKYITRGRQMCCYPKLVPSDLYNSFLDNIDEANDASSSLSKMDKVSSEIIKRGDNGNKKIVFCVFHGEMIVLANKLIRNGLDVGIIHGAINKKIRNEILNSNKDILIMQIQTCCEGLNLQTYNEVYFVTPWWNPAVEDQAIGRCHRIGQKNTVQVFRFFMKSNFEVNKDLNDKEKMVPCMDEYIRDMQKNKKLNY